MNTTHDKETRFFTGFMAALKASGMNHITVSGNQPFERFAVVAGLFNSLQNSANPVEGFPERLDHDSPASSAFGRSLETAIRHGWLTSAERRPVYYEFGISETYAGIHLAEPNYTDRERAILHALASRYKHNQMMG